MKYRFLLPYIPVKDPPCGGDLFLEYPDMNDVPIENTQLASTHCFSCMHASPIPEEFTYSQEIEVDEPAYGKCLGSDIIRWILSALDFTDSIDRC